MNVEELAECALDANTRILRRITMDDARTAAEAAEMIEVLMGSDVARRKDYLIENSTLFDTEALDI
jgi:DNA gyrase subunit B